MATIAKKGNYIYTFQKQASCHSTLSPILTLPCGVYCAPMSYIHPLIATKFETEDDSAIDPFTRSRHIHNGMDRTSNHNSVASNERSDDYSELDEDTANTNPLSHDTDIDQLDATQMASPTRLCAKPNKNTKTCTKQFGKRTCGKPMLSTEVGLYARCTACRQQDKLATQRKKDKEMSAVRSIGPTNSNVQIPSRK